MYGMNQIHHYSRKSHLKTALYLESFLHEAFISNVEEMIEKCESVAGEKKLDWHEFQGQFENFKVCLKAQSKLEELGYIPALNETFKGNVTNHSGNNHISVSEGVLGKGSVETPFVKTLSTIHVLEHQTVHHIDGIIKHHQGHNHHSKLDDLINLLKDLKNILQDHFEKKESIILPFIEKYLSKEEMINIHDEAISKLMEEDTTSYNLLHSFSFTKNNLELTETMLKEVISAKSSVGSNANLSRIDNILREFVKHMPKEVFLQLQDRIPELKNF
ncbi:hypothetical protein ABK040_009742 [Willaertia magna]